MAGFDRKIYHFLFVATVIALVVFKWSDLHLPYFWDELGVYTRAADYQMHHVISLMPSSLPPESSRGHPLLFTFMNAWVVRIFGEQVFVEHLFCFFISVLLLLAVYIKVSRYYDRLTGIVSVVVLSVQPLFLAQSCLVLPEITLALFAFLAICYYYENKFFLFALFASLAVLTKEAAIVLPLAVLSYSVLRWALLRVRPAALTPTAIFLTIIPYAIFGVFLMIQKKQNGWYFFPLHINHVEVSANVFLQQLHDFTSFLFWDQGRNLSTNTCIIAAVVAVLMGKWVPNRVGRSFTLLLFVLGAAILGFNSVINLYMERYATAVLVVFSILIAVSVTSILKNRFLVAVFVIIIVIASSQNLESRGFDYDADLGYRREVNTLQQAVDYILDTAKAGEKVLGSYPIGYAFTFDAGGYLKGRKVSYLWDENEDHYYLLLCDPGCSLDMDDSKHQLYYLKKFNDGYAQVRVYMVKRK